GRRGPTSAQSVSKRLRLYRKRILSGASAPKPVYCSSIRCRPGGIFSFSDTLTGAPSTMISSSSNVGGTNEFVSSQGWVATTPMEVENQSSPDLVFKPAGKNP